MPEPTEKRIEALFRKAPSFFAEDHSTDGEFERSVDALFAEEARIEELYGEKAKFLLSRYLGAQLRISSYIYRHYFRHGYLAGWKDGKADQS